MKTAKILAKSPIPAPKVGRPKTTIFPWEAIEVEQSFVAGEFSDSLMTKVSSAAHYYGEKLNKKFVCRNDNGLLKVWRAE